MLYYSKLPDLAGKTVVVLDPMVATGGSVICAIQMLISNGADPARMFFFNVVSCPEGLAKVTAAFPGNVTARVLSLLSDTRSRHLMTQPSESSLGLWIVTSMKRWVG